MGALTGLAVLGVYDGSNDLETLFGLIPDPDTSPAQSGGNQGFLDEMSPGAAAQLRVELIALGANGGAGAVDGVGVRNGQYTVLAADDTANQFDIVTGLANITLTNCAVSIRRAGTEILTARTLSEPVAGTIRVADSTYQATAGDIVTWFARGG